MGVQASSLSIVAMSAAALKTTGPSSGPRYPSKSSSLSDSDGMSCMYSNIKDGSEGNLVRAAMVLLVLLKENA